MGDDNVNGCWKGETGRGVDSSLNHFEIVNNLQMHFVITCMQCKVKITA